MNSALKVELFDQKVGTSLKIVKQIFNNSQNCQSIILWTVTKSLSHDILSTSKFYCTPF